MVSLAEGAIQKTGNTYSEDVKVVDSVVDYKKTEFRTSALRENEN